jgi:hypothetical protein
MFSSPFKKIGVVTVLNKQIVRSNDIRSNELESVGVLDHLTEKSFHRKKMAERLFTEKSVDRTPFDRMPFDQKFI